LECANVTAIGEDAPPFMDRLVGEESLGSKVYTGRQDYLLDFTTGETWAQSVAGLNVAAGRGTG
jgi:hypothetical protein